MKKRTKIELIIFALVAIFFLYTQVSGIDGNDEGTGNPSSIETELKNMDSTSQSGAAETESNADNEDGAQSDNGTDKKVISNNSSGELSKSSSDSNGQSASAYAIQGESYADNSDSSADSTLSAGAENVSEDGVYTDKDQVALYIASYGHLPRNYITKNEAKAAGWVSSEGNLDEVCPGMSIGGDKFGNREGKLPEKKNRKYYECDINYDKTDGYRGSERIIYSNDGLIYYTGDHYNTFELLYGEP